MHRWRSVLSVVALASISPLVTSLYAAESRLADYGGEWVTEQGGYRISLRIDGSSGASELTSTFSALAISTTERGVAEIGDHSLVLKVFAEDDFTHELGERHYEVIELTPEHLDLIWDGPVVRVRLLRSDDKTSPAAKG